MPRVPTTKEVLPGANVNIVLKADQPTGRTVSGTIADVLTRGNHPRGIKVRLTDGRVGRVQSMSTSAGGQSSDPAAAAEFSRGRAPRDRRGEADEPPQNIGLDAYITQPSRQKRRAPTVTCPVCGVFEGDEAAVAYHVASHFD
ncbi:YwbE family protein [Aspergillus brunneoviolaceus CBS 621.78]|uniref:UBZ4-type domain-containing protein n=2 Tax=Aspergillus TaxID=5052 RepID=A0A8G1RKZ9_9EURO|nr:hypothetical protein BO95DRAFT_453535 [Aspergillus brunneoviolaceus CBS 621.78]XP_040798618.1 uncharacterized protein BO72DRAFT_470644 [Aspergillus fijiensis CBS 313.89]RAH45307.1 hypothetical protein BO95DRAFT_453535 [Aspergillus brunneoviolaceus CBS 621.78]RAK74608.1 hypothetical protein BO72DRAFT_470644 [Aspergillus fijiensis CBS 313.89]